MGEHDLAAATTMRDHLISFASNARTKGARLRLDLTEMPWIGSSSYGAETTAAIGAIVTIAQRLADARPSLGQSGDKVSLHFRYQHDAGAVYDALAQLIDATDDRREPAVVQGAARCEVCDWPLADSRERGCVPGNCSYRPENPAEQQRLDARRRAVNERAIAERSVNGNTASFRGTYVASAEHPPNRRASGSKIAASLRTEVGKAAAETVDAAIGGHDRDSPADNLSKLSNMSRRSDSALSAIYRLARSAALNDDLPDPAILRRRAENIDDAKEKKIFLTMAVATEAIQSLLSRDCAGRGANDTTTPPSWI